MARGHVGGTDINNRPEALRGDATVQYEARSVVHVSFTNIRNIDAGQLFHNMGWSGNIRVGFQTRPHTRAIGHLTKVPCWFNL